MRNHFKTLNDRIIPFDRVFEIRLTLHDEDATISKLANTYVPDFYICIDDGTIEAFSASEASSWYVEPEQWIEHWTSYRQKQTLGEIQ